MSVKQVLNNAYKIIVNQKFGNKEQQYSPKGFNQQ